jgi:predicted RNA-binding Zn-ribbon protein involved in translation (DUF1610 family)
MTFATSFSGLYVNGNGPQTLLLDKNSITIPDLNGFPKKDLELKGALLEERRRFGLGMLWLGILLFFLMGVGVIFIILYYYVKIQVLVITTVNGNELVLKGSKDTLDDLHYMIQKRCLKKIKKERKREKVGTKGKRSKAVKGGVTTLTCPQCGSHDLYYEAGLHTGRKYHCKRCDYIGALVIEESIEP